MAITDQFPNGLRVLVVDDDSSCLFILQKMLLRLMYKVTICSQADVALKILREKKDCFDLVLSDVHMPVMNGYKLLQQVGLEMDLPVIMMSVDGRTSTVMTGINHGACDYLIKPIRPEELKNIWQHVVPGNLLSSQSLEDNKRSCSLDTVLSFSECSEASLKLQKKKKKKKKRCVDREDNEDDDLLNLGNSKKSRVVWSIELHQQFVNAVNQLGIDKAVPKRILELMKVPSLSRENVASHLQKFRLYLKRLSGAASQSSSDMESIKRYENIEALVSSGQLHPLTLAALIGQPTEDHLSGGFGVWIPNDDLGGSQNGNIPVDVSSASNWCLGALNSPVSVNTPKAVHGLSSSANIRQNNNNNIDHISNVNEESWILERSSRQIMNQRY